MKVTKLTYLLMIGLALTFVAAGCKKKPVNVTNLPSPRTGGPKDPGQAGIVDPGTGVTPGGIATSTSWDPGDPNLVADRTKLAMHTVHFAFDSAAVRTSEKSHVSAVSAELKGDTAAKLLIEGHCDERGTEEYNRSLGERRALALREALVAGGIDPDRIRTVSFGEDKPFAQGHDEAVWSQNRRGEFVLYHPK